MSPDYARAVDPVFVGVLDLLNRISQRNTRGVSEEKAKLLAKLRDAESQLGSTEGWQLSKYALAAWIDEMLIAAPWDGRTAWENNTLEFDFFRTQTRATDFFLKSQEADKLPSNDPIEVYFLCVLLGFRGFYAARPEDAAFIAQQKNLPQTLEMWTSIKSRRIQLFRVKEPEVKSRPLEGAPPLHGKFLVVGSTLLCLMMICVFAVVWYYFLHEKLMG